MLESIDIHYYLRHMIDVPIIDVRSPGEYEKGHISHSHNLPLLSNEERAAIGTVYKQESKEKAIELGKSFVHPKKSHYVNEAKSLAKNGMLAVHCWRGGMRSHAVAEYLSEHGVDKVFVINGGYKAFRSFVLNSFNEDCELKVIGGFTGSGKTEVLQELKQRSEQVIDLEALANHKGSAFGGIGLGKQPTVEQFENDLFAEWFQLDKSKPIWIEDESRNIGSVIIPQGLFNNMREQRVYFMDIPAEERAKLLVKGYAECNKEDLEQSLLKISKRLGGLNTTTALNYLLEQKYFDATLIALYYYDKVYLHGLNKRNPKQIEKIALSSTDPKNNTDQLLKLTKNKHGH